ncbi:MAG TPA: preprotein translocase subunit YajC [Polyangia bacterium]|nr:preprotein translocase subunit YajC [Polyangia bacterium]
MTSALYSLAQAAPPAGGAASPFGALGSFLPIILIFGVFFLLVIRPQQKKAKEHQNMLSQLKAGDIVVTQGGIIGKITGIKDLEVTIEVQQGVRLKVLRSHVTNKHTPGEAAKADAKAS